MKTGFHTDLQGSRPSRLLSSSPLFLPTFLYFVCSFLHGVARLVRGRRTKANVSIISFLLHNTEAQKTGKKDFAKYKAWWNNNVMKKKKNLGSLSALSRCGENGAANLKACMVLTGLGGSGPEKKQLGFFFFSYYSHWNEQTIKFGKGFIKR